MRSNRLSLVLTVVLAIFATSLVMTGARAFAQTESVLHMFNYYNKDGTEPVAGLIFDASGNLYGTTLAGGAYNCGTAFELLPKAGGGWTEKILHSFNNNGRDGYSPLVGLIFDASGNLYGTTSQGGPNNGGVVFELSPNTGGGWTEKIVHGFTINGTTGSYPQASLIFDALGNLYGTTNAGGTHGPGAVFELMPKAGGGWTEKVLYSFNNNGTDGKLPRGGLIFDGGGNLYGTTYQGGSSNGGTVFKLTPAAGGGWTETVLHSFGSGQDGNTPMADLILDAAGNLYGTTFYGGANAFGMVFELTPGAGGSWTETVVHNFSNNATDGGFPSVGLVSDSSGSLYGATQKGGSLGYGVVFKLTPTTGGSWTETVLHDFGSSRDGVSPQGNLIFDAVGNLYGTTYEGGGGWGTVFEITP
jgi:uncharacterized repeat protein (TIGR03803 family)